MPAGQLLKENREKRGVFVRLMINRIIPALEDDMPLDAAEYWLEHPDLMRQAMFETLAARSTYPLLPREVTTRLDLVA